MNKPLSITMVNDNERLPKGQKKITIKRNRDYNLKAVLEFEDLGFQRKDGPAGSFVQPFEISGSSFNGLYHYTLDNSLIGSTRTVIDNEEKKSSRTARLRLSGLRIRTNEVKEVAHLSEWILNGPNMPVFSRGTLRKLSKNYSRERHDTSGNIIESIVKTSQSSIPTEFLLIKTTDYQFVIGTVPQGLGPSWSSNISIEYKTTWGKIPSDTDREEIREILSFIFGRQLLSIGYTTFDKDENLVEAYSNNPWGYCAKSYCSKGDYFPIYIDIWHQGKAEKTINELLPRYHETCELLNLKEAIWNYWVSREMPIGTNLIALASGVESIIYGWFSNKSHSNVFLEREKFESLLKEEITSIQNKLKSIPEGDKILDNILRSNEAGIMRRYKIFFEQIGLKISDDEWEAIEERHIFVHGKALLDKIDWHKVAIHTRAFEVLFNKILLKVLGYTGSYIDYTTINCPEVQLT
jgi:hypothetical protein